MDLVSEFESNPRGQAQPHLFEHTERFGSDEVRDACFLYAPWSRPSSCCCNMRPFDACVQVVVLETFDEQPQLAVDTTLRQASRWEPDHACHSRNVPMLSLVHALAPVNHCSLIL